MFRYVSNNVPVILTVRTRGRPERHQASESRPAGPVCCNGLILIMASEGRVGACPKGKRSRCYPCLSVGFSGRTCLPTTMRAQAPTGTSGVCHALLHPTASILLRRRSARQNDVLVHPRRGRPGRLARMPRSPGCQLRSYCTVMLLTVADSDGSPHFASMS